MENSGIGAAAAPTGPKPMTQTPAMALRLLQSVWAAAVYVVLLATFAVEAVPHARGIGFFPRYGLRSSQPCAFSSRFAAALLYRALAEGLGTAARGIGGGSPRAPGGRSPGDKRARPPGLTAAAFPALLSVPVAVAFFVPLLR